MSTADSTQTPGLAAQQDEQRIARNVVWHGGASASRLMLPTGTGAARTG